jgi:hypothetical protein
METIQHPYDVLLWPDAERTWCYAIDVSEYSHMSDDYERIEYCSGRWCELTECVPY